MTEEQRQLAYDNHNLIYFFLKKHSLSAEDYYDLAAIGLCKAASKFDSNISKFSTLAYHCMLNEVLKEKRKGKSKKAVPKDQLFYFQAKVEDEHGRVRAAALEIPSSESVEETAVSKIVIQKFLNILKDSELQILSLLNQGFTQCQVGEMVGISQAQVSRIRTKMVKTLTMERQ